MQLFFALLFSAYMGEGDMPEIMFSYHGDRPALVYVSTELLNKHFDSLESLQKTHNFKSLLDKVNLSPAEMALFVREVKSSFKTLQKDIAGTEDVMPFVRQQSKPCFYNTPGFMHWSRYHSDEERIKSTNHVYSGRIVSVKSYIHLGGIPMAAQLVTLSNTTDLKTGQKGPNLFHVLVPQGSAIFGDLKFCSFGLGEGQEIPQVDRRMLVFTNFPLDQDSVFHAGSDRVSYESPSGALIQRVRDGSGKTAPLFDEFLSTTKTLIHKGLQQ